MEKTTERAGFVGAAEAAKYLGLSLSTLYCLTHRRVVPFYKPDGKNIYFSLDELDKWIRDSRIPNI